MRKLLSFPLLFLGVLSAAAEIKTEVVDYKQGDTVLEGLHVYDTSIQGKRPGILVVHQWKGAGPYEKMRAEMLAKLGYNVFVADIYGKGVRPTDPAEAGKTAGLYKGNRPLVRERMEAALAELKKSDLTDGNRIAAIGYCFGGMGVLELARDGAPIAGVVSFHGELSNPTPADAKNIKCKVLVLHGADDPKVPPASVNAFEEEMRLAGVDWQLVSYGGAVHSFTDRNAGNDNSTGVAYNEKADQRSWKAMKVFFKELFEPPKN